MKKTLLSTVVTVFFGFSSQASAQGIPVIDGSSLGQLVQQINQMMRDYDVQTGQLGTLQAQLQNGIAQLTNLEAQLNSLLDGADMSKLFAAAEDFEKLKGMVEDPMAAMQAIASGTFSGGFSANGGGAELAQSALASAGISPEMMSAMSAGSVADHSLAQNAGAAAMLSAASQDANGAASGSLDRIQTMVGMIDDQAGVKSAIDLNTRVTAELGIILVQMWRLEAAQGVSAGQMGVADAATIAAERKFRSMSLQ